MDLNESSVPLQGRHQRGQGRGTNSQSRQQNPRTANINRAGEIDRSITSNLNGQKGARTPRGRGQRLNTRRTLYSTSEPSFPRMNRVSSSLINPNRHLNAGLSTRNISTNVNTGDLSSTEMADFLENGLTQITESEDSRSCFIGYLSSETGLARVRQVVKAEFAETYSVSKLQFLPHCAFFLKIITHDEILKSYRLEKDVVTIYNVLYGHASGGNLGADFFRNITRYLGTVKPNAATQNGIAEAEFLDILFPLVKALDSILNFVQAASINPTFQAITLQFLGDTDFDTFPEDLMRSILYYCARIRSKIEVSQSIDTYKREPQKQQQQSDKSNSRPQLDFPGELSAFGKRHDNDYEDIASIRILPTLSEIMCWDREDFLPTTLAYSEIEEHHRKGITRLIDIQFRLLREDNSGLLRDTSRFIIENWQNIVVEKDWKIKRQLIKQRSPTPIRVYSNPLITCIQPDPRRGLEVSIEFDQIHTLRKATKAKREFYWRKSRELRENKSILALIKRNGEDVQVVFFVVCRRDISLPEEEQHNDVTSSRRSRDLAGSAERALITLRLADPSYSQDLVNLFSIKSQHMILKAYDMDQSILVEFPAIVFRSFDGVLRSLQHLQRDPASLPFGRWLSPQLLQSIGSTDNIVSIPSPTYLRGVTLDLSCFRLLPQTSNTTESNQLNFTLSDDAAAAIDTISNETSLDRGQAAAMVTSLRHEMSLIQGPPGTGKSYVGVKIVEALLHNAELLELGPIVCVCYTAHALDQFLQDLLDLGITKIARIGTPSQSIDIENLSLDNHKKRQARPQIRGLGHQIKQIRAILDQVQGAMKNICDELQSNRQIISSYMEKRFPEYLIKLQDGLSYANVRPDITETIREWVLGGDSGNLFGSVARSIEDMIDTDPWILLQAERVQLYEFWYKSAHSEQTQALMDLHSKYNNAKQILTSLNHESDMKILEQMEVLGITTTGLANNAELVRRVPAKVLICEEAGEVLEAHILTALLPSLQHTVLIGDHLQLRPKISRNHLSKEYERGRNGNKYNLDESLFERLANANSKVSDEAVTTNTSPVSQLTVQRRMHPSISDLVRKTLYPGLLDHEMTTVYPEVSGMKRRLFWLDHRNQEDAGEPGEIMQSKTNTWEADMITALVKHLCKQGAYKSGEIAVITPYLAQLRLLKDMLEQVVDLVINERDLEDLDISDNESSEPATQAKGNASMKGTAVKGRLLDQLKISTVDNFQGEEASVILVSLVRSNKRKDCGFLKTPNRINVLLSRARHGMYIIGDASTAIPAPMWTDIVRQFEETTNIGSKLQLTCSRHPEKQIFVTVAADFDSRSPEGGCSEQCNLRLECGHRCKFKCHADHLHNAVRCVETCPRPRKCGHACLKPCSAKCGSCQTLVSNIILSCGHIVNNVECRSAQQPENIKCRQKQMRTLEHCGHEVNTLCSTPVAQLTCSKVCAGELACGHACRQLCPQCKFKDPGSRERIHYGTCTMSCGKQYTSCSHFCTKPCHLGVSCPPCDKRCDVQCKHSRCPKKCSDPCPPCAEICEWTCKHRPAGCNLPCAIPCDIEPCNSRCEKLLKSCQHQCPGLCGEECPDSKFCQICSSEGIKTMVVDFEESCEYRETDTTANPIVFLPCGHFFARSSMDGWLELTRHYEKTEDSNRGVLISGNAPKGCPLCRLPIRGISRYNRILKSTSLDQSTRRFVSRSSARVVELAEMVQDWEQQAETNRIQLVGKLRTNSQAPDTSNETGKAAIKQYKAPANYLLKQILSFEKGVQEIEQPFGRVNSMLIACMDREGYQPHEYSQFNHSFIQTGFKTRAKCLRFQLQYARLQSLIKVSTNPNVSLQLREPLRDSTGSDVVHILKEIDEAVKACGSENIPRYEVQVRIFHALFTAMDVTAKVEKGKVTEGSTCESMRKQGFRSLGICDDLISKHPGTCAGMKSQVEDARRMLNGGTFYDSVSTEEKMEVYKAMAAQFQGTGHWYYCRNFHPFTIGECGMAMELARCPECNEPIGGQDHQSVAGVERAEDMEALSR